MVVEKKEDDKKMKKERGVGGVIKNAWLGEKKGEIIESQIKGLRYKGKRG